MRGFARACIRSASAGGTLGVPIPSSVILVIYAILTEQSLAHLFLAAMILVTVPVFLPVMLALDFGLSPEAVIIWFGIIVLCVVEVGLITPPIGLNVYVINSMAQDVPMTESFRGIIPFFLSDLVRIEIIIGFPATATWLDGIA